MKLSIFWSNVLIALFAFLVFWAIFYYVAGRFSSDRQTATPENAPEQNQTEAKSPPATPPASDVTPPSDGAIDVAGDEPPAESHNAGAGLLIALVATILLAIALAVSIFLNTLLLKWHRTIDTEDGPVKLVVPAQYDATLQKQNKSLDNQRSDLERQAQTLKKVEKDIKFSVNNTTRLKQEFHTQAEATNSHTMDHYEKLINAFATLQAALNAKDRDIKRLRDGYDQVVFRKFLSRFVTVDAELTLLQQDLASGTAIDDKMIQGVRKLMSSAFEECDVVEFSPSCGETIKGMPGIEENPKQRETTDPAQVHTIAEVVEPGLKLEGHQGGEGFYIKKAKVVVFVDNKKDKS